jgi:hypothetical protein
VRAAWLGGAKWFMPTAKHHDGLDLWPSKHGLVNVSNAGYTNDVVRLFQNAAQKYSVHFAIYFSVWDQNDTNYESCGTGVISNNSGYFHPIGRMTGDFTTAWYPASWSYMTNQLTELLTQYGTVELIFFDGFFAEDPCFWHPRELYSLVRHLQPNCQVVMGGAEMINGQNNMTFPTDFRFSESSPPRAPTLKTYSSFYTTNSYFIPWLSGMTMTADTTWFWNTNTESRLWPVGVLTNNISAGLAQTNAFMLNLSPDTNGVLSAAETNLFESAGAALGFPRAGFVQNGGFETGTFNNWSLSGITAYLTVSIKPDYVHSGRYGAQLGPFGALSYLSQNFATIPGEPYLLSLWLDSPYGGTPNEFTVSWNGTTLFDGTNLGAFGWTNLQFTVAAMSTNSQLQIGVRNDPSYFGLDDVGVTPIASMPPLITQSPVNQTVPIGGNARFNLTAIGSPPLAYQWVWNTNSPLGGATNIVLSLGPVTTNLAGYYQTVITNFYGSITSSPAALTVQLVPNIYQISNRAGGPVTLYLASIPGSTNRLWTSTNLMQWQAIATNYADNNGFFQITDPDATGYNLKVYRLSCP